MVKRSSTIFIPANPLSLKDMTESVTFGKPLVQNGFRTGLMLLLKEGTINIDTPATQQLYKNCTAVIQQFGPQPLVLMLPNMDFDNLDFYHRTEQSQSYVNAAVDLLHDIEGESDTRIVSFHLNTLMSPDEWTDAGILDQRIATWKQRFDMRVWPAIAHCAEYAAQKNIRLVVETTPVPEFGDLPNSKLSSLGNPFPLYTGRGFAEVRSTGAHLALDLCHTYTLYSAAKLLSDRHSDNFDIYKGLFPQDIPKFADSSFLTEIESLTAGDLIHLNDSRGLFNPTTNSLHTEGVILGEGDIKTLPSIIKTAISKSIDIVFEINETNYVQRPNLLKSIAFFLQNI